MMLSEDKETLIPETIIPDKFIEVPVAKNCTGRLYYKHKITGEELDSIAHLPPEIQAQFDFVDESFKPAIQIQAKCIRKDIKDSTGKVIKFIYGYDSKTFKAMIDTITKAIVSEDDPRIKIITEQKYEEV